MGEKFYRNTWVEVDLDAIAHNVRAFRAHLPEQTQIMAVVKADGYGHGAIPVAKEALAAGATYLGVALLDEAIELREAGITAPVLVLGYTAPEFVGEAITRDITLTVFHPEVIVAIQNEGARLDKQAKIHIKLDTGMGRVGVRTQEELDQLMQAVAESDRVEAEGVFTHFACADEEDPSYTTEQHHTFIKVIEPYTFPIIHCSNSAGGILYPNWGYNMIRLGISLYGQYPSAFTRNKGIELKEAFSLKTKIAHIKSVPAGTSISYGATFTTSGESVIASLPIGYADGFSRALSNKGQAIVKGTRTPIVGRVCMDQLMIDISSVIDPRVGDEVVLIGSQGGQQITVDDVADQLQTINYEVTCMISKRVPRVYRKGGDTVMTKNFLL
ncbi:alanine racemase [Ammoniphilus sp. CFH 90114]|uniref:alanine racemase n=1 Tax=Ammoniphilus sp. CFH 90114 TaxID=2493665 RepID=UPI00100F2D49|nr:alanine racemase [Ammoniphilus sp. CFH 90114]RXT05200.1 alanine racemase [Ammoniphilus sp. CFH 90114]